jgi:hypothetical protein
MLHFDLHHISKSKKNKTISTFSQVVDCSGSLLSLLGDAIDYYSHEKSDDMYFNENRIHIQSLLLELYKISPYSREMVVIESPIKREEEVEGKTIILDTMLIKQRKTDVMKMFQNGVKKREPQRDRQQEQREPLPEPQEQREPLPEEKQSQQKFKKQKKSKNIISFDTLL